MLRRKGPYTVVHRVTLDHYVLNVNSCNHQYHINQLNLYRDDPEAHRDPALALPTAPPGATSSITPSGAAAAQVLHYSHSLPPTLECSSLVVEADLLEWGFLAKAPLPAATALAMEDITLPFDDGKDPAIPTSWQENRSDCTINPRLQPGQREQLTEILEHYENVFNDLPGATTTIEHHVRLTDPQPFRNSYGLPHQLSVQLKEDLKTWVSLGIVEKSNSPSCSPLLAVRKRDSSHRFCLDCRKLNACTIFDGEPIVDAEHIFSSLKIGSGQWILASPTERGYQAPNSLFHKIWSVPVQGHALWDGEFPWLLQQAHEDSTTRSRQSFVLRRRYPDTFS